MYHINILAVLTVSISCLVFNAHRGVNFSLLAALTTFNCPFLSSRVSAESPCTEHQIPFAICQV